VSPQRILAPHIAATVRRCIEAHEVVVAHDTTKVSYSSPRQGLGRINDKGQGFFAHVALAIRADGSREPLGVLGVQTHTRQDPPRQEHHTERFAEQDRESFRWKRMVQEIAPLVGDQAQLVHVMDSEADAFELLARLVEQRNRFVIRLKYDRIVHDEEGQRTHLHTKLGTLQGQCTRDVQLSARAAPTSGRKRNQARSTRPATLVLSATPVILARSDGAKGPKRLTVNVVHVREVSPPPDTEPVDWKLLTTEPIARVADLERIVDFYRARWLIEEFFKALKTGCALEKRQLESLSGLLNAMAVFVPIAFELLRMRAVARLRPDTPASTIFRPLQLQILERHPKLRLPPHATVRATMLAVAQLGGHIKNNGDPGWLVLGRGYEKLLVMEEGALVASKKK